jgi:hypothetical protein
MASYLKATHHPWPCLLFVVPLLLIYEIGVHLLGGNRPEALRNGADYWFRSGLQIVGVPGFWWLPPLLLLLGLAIWLWRCWGDRPSDMTGTMSGIVIESVAFALGLWGVSRALLPILARMAVGEEDSPLRNLLPLIGAGVYEEALFRLVLFSVLLVILRWLGVTPFLSCGIAALFSAVLFSAAHHMGPYGQEYHDKLFLFRTAAGGYFALLFYWRGFAIAVGAHACYNVMITVGV